ncbi:MAG: endolytic transglycosylase MltG [Candidatus Levybacteria bacterium]|nr:endolytic transglycosylase MltG [Candidatus Levybacteria bacterium]
MKMVLILIFVFVFLIAGFVFLNPFAAPGKSPKTEIITLDSEKKAVAGLKLEEAGFVKSMTAFEIAMTLTGNKKIESGGYYLSKNMDAFEVADALSQGPDLKWVTVLPGMRKEQIGERLKETLNWDDEELKKWNTEYTTQKEEYTEGVYFPDTYLIPVKENGQLIAARMINNFNDKFSDYYDDLAEKNIRWTTAIKIASLIQREAGGEHDMPLIAGVMWNRLNNNQKLDIDATIQYAIGKRDGKWWSVVTGSDIRETNSPYNTYKYSGLPPYPISNPSLAAIEAVLNPQDTDCIFYLHDKNREIHCSVTYEEHLEYIDTYLRN